MKREEIATELEIIELQLDIERALGTRVGKYLEERAYREISEAQEALAIIDPTNTAGIVELQNQIYRARSITQWLAQAIMDGLNTQVNLMKAEGEG